ncbi:MAG: sulfate ABC transporter substrate-binding protein [Rhodobacteraceae bacterium]|nr:sulfate ABC transporter substrate-binding protein [Paracoccaceae bacterium]
MKFVLTAVMTSLLAVASQAETLKMAVTTSFYNSGLSEMLLPAIKADLDLDVELIVVGTGQALRLGEAGDVDAILVHARAAEDRFLAAGYGTHRREIMYNDFVFVGPSSDPAEVANATSAVEALQAIASNQAPFVSRGDDSGTHKMEMALWADSGMAAEGAWYRAAGSGMGATLNVASGMNAYTFTDRASWLNFGNKGELGMLYAGDPALFNQYAYIPVNPVRWPHVRHDLALALEGWLTGETANHLINGYALNGEQLFTFNAQP